MAMLTSGRRILDVIYYAMIMLHKQRNLEPFKFIVHVKKKIYEYLKFADDSFINMMQFYAKAKARKQSLVQHWQQILQNTKLTLKFTCIDLSRSSEYHISS